MSVPLAKRTGLERVFVGAGQRVSRDFLLCPHCQNGVHLWTAKQKNICIDETVTVRLWNTENMSENILQSRLDKKQKICTFTHLSSRNRYAITVDNMPDISISVSSRLTFCEAFSQALQNE